MPGDSSHPVRGSYHAGSPRGCISFILTVLILPLTDVAQAQQLPGGSELRRPSERELELPEFERREEVLPPLRPLPPERERAPSVGIRIFVREFELTGNTVFSDEELGEVAAPYEGREIGNEELDALRQALTLYYVDRGYVNSGAVIPDQRVEDGIIRIQIIEGELSEIHIQGNERLRSNYLTERLAFGAGPPLNINELQERLQIVLQDPAIERVNADLRPGDRPGDAKLVVNVDEPPLIGTAFAIDNDISPSVGTVRGRFLGTLRNPTGWGDSLTAEFDYADGLTDISGSYAIPITRWDTRFIFLGETIDSEVVQEPFDDLDIESEFWSLGGRLEQPVYRTPREEIVLGLQFERRESQTFLLGVPFPFSPGVEPNGKSKVSVLRFTQDWLRRSPNRVLAARSTMSFGMDVLDATISNAPDSKFFAWLGQVQWAQRLSNRGDQVLFRADGQVATDGLLPLEQYAVGGSNSVRGYRKNQLVRDQGFSVSLEYRTPPPGDFFRDAAGRPTLQLAAFVDAGGAWFIDRDEPDPTTIVSVGPGLRWDPHPNVHAELYWGYALEDVSNPGHDIQDSGIHFQFRITPF